MKNKIFNTNTIRNQIYKDWVLHNQSRYAKSYSIFPIAVMTLLIFFDLFALDNPRPFLIIRAVSIVLLSINSVSVFFLLNKLKNDNQKYIATTISLMTTGVILITDYLIFSFYLKHNAFFSYFTGLLLITAFTTFLAYRLRRTQIYFSIFCTITGLLSFYSIEHVNFKIIYLITIFVSIFMSTYFRAEFVKTLENRYLSLKAIVPKRIAKYMITHNSPDIEGAFEGKNRFVVCLCSDWRNYQQILEQYPPEYITKVTEEFYDKVFAKLDEISPDGQYFPNWTADELFIVFYSESKEYDQKIVNESLLFAKALAGEIFLEVRYDFDVDLKYDIGMASGVGFLGVQGPKKLKKTTITSEAAGVSKRLETEAKELRKVDPTNANPVLLLDQTLYIASLEDKVFTSKEFQEINASTKNILGKRFYKIQNSYLDIFNIVKKIS
ncbi:MAG: hypothetical protein HOO06_05480 [Bdellovibrionaceae bacterium]|jgi:hypothetical protein|nr:hypothetical protein [Pseudobdellovibrionaceae bacterium]